MTAFSTVSTWSWRETDAHAEREREGGWVIGRGHTVTRMYERKEGCGQKTACIASIYMHCMPHAFSDFFSVLLSSP